MLILFLGKRNIRKKSFGVYVSVKSAKVSSGMWSFLFSSHVGRSSRK
jgi:hypothetical protein